jgi:uncharacterized membrane protein
MFKYPKKISDWLIWLIIFLGIVGLADSSYLTYKHYVGGNSIICNIASGACDVVTTSKYSMIIGVPVAILGVFFYLFVFALLYRYIKSKKQKALRFFVGWTTLGFFVSAYLTYLQAFVIHAYCKLCITSAIVATLIFLNTISLFKRSNKGVIAGV